MNLKLTWFKYYRKMKVSWERVAVEDKSGMTWRKSITFKNQKIKSARGAFIWNPNSWLKVEQFNKNWAVSRLLYHCWCSKFGKLIHKEIFRKYMSLTKAAINILINRINRNQSDSKSNIDLNSAEMDRFNFPQNDKYSKHRNINDSVNWNSE